MLRQGCWMAGFPFLQGSFISGERVFVVFEDARNAAPAAAHVVLGPLGWNGTWIVRGHGAHALNCAMIIVHHLNNSRSQRILWLLEELDLPYEIRHYQRDPQTKLAPPELLSVHPLGKSPVITDSGLTIAESGAIIEYLVERYGNGALIPP